MIRRTLAIAGTAVLTAGVTGLAGPAAADSGTGITANGNLQISEVSAQLDSSSPDHDYDDNFIELVNNTDGAFPIGGFTLESCNATNAPDDVLTFAPGTQVPAKGHLLIGTPDFAGSFSDGDLDFVRDIDLVQSAGGVRLLDASLDRVDDVMWGPPANTECANFVPAGTSPTDHRSINQTSPDTWEQLVPTPTNAAGETG